MVALGSPSVRAGLLLVRLTLFTEICTVFRIALLFNTPGPKIDSVGRVRSKQNNCNWTNHIKKINYCLDSSRLRDPSLVYSLIMRECGNLPSITVILETKICSKQGIYIVNAHLASSFSCVRFTDC